jgi:hypothetical protein
MQMDSSAVDAGAALLAHYYQEIGDHEGLEFTGKALDAAYAARMRVARERGRVTTQDVYAPHALTDEQLDGFRRQVRGLDTIEKAWVVRKHVSDDPNEPPHFVVLVAWRGIIFSEGGNLQRAVDAIELPGSVIVITAPNQRAIARRVRKAAGEPMFVR